MRIVSLISLVALPWLSSPLRASEDAALIGVERLVRDAYPDVVHIEPTQLEDMLASRRSEIVLFDVREPDEWRVGHLERAYQVSPSIWSSQLIANFADRVKDRTVVFYCSVGVRSSRLAGRAQQALMAAGARAVFNVSGGIFRWHNEHRALFSGDTPTAFVHPFDSYWGKFVTRQDLTRTRPQRQD